MYLKIHTLIELGIWIWFVEKKVKLGNIWAGRIPQSIKNYSWKSNGFVIFFFKIKVSNWNMPKSKAWKMLFEKKFQNLGNIWAKEYHIYEGKILFFVKYGFRSSI